MSPRRREHGGRRKGAGRPPLSARGSRVVAVRLPRDVIAWLEDQRDEARPTTAAVIRDVIGRARR